MDKNLYEEYIDTLHHYGYTTGDIKWIEVDNCEIGSTLFEEIAREINYDSGYGTQEINPTLKIVMNDGCWFERHEYDGSEWWSYYTLPERPVRFIPVTKEMLYDTMDW